MEMVNVGEFRPVFGTASIFPDRVRRIFCRISLLPEPLSGFALFDDVLLEYGYLSLESLYITRLSLLDQYE
jgi:hypothetical protein